MDRKFEGERRGTETHGYSSLCHLNIAYPPPKKLSHQIFPRTVWIHQLFVHIFSQAFLIPPKYLWFLHFYIFKNLLSFWEKSEHKEREKEAHGACTLLGPKFGIYRRSYSNYLFIYTYIFRYCRTHTLISVCDLFYTRFILNTYHKHVDHVWMVMVGRSFNFL